ncbi:aminotransferase class I/II-fold pyridoxal phosphate-dependent enzyme [Mangrovicoccus algicola]|uniref:Aminotransferase class I/II-fold pyridoxal phosphate-dependent enzyme n=1 Tax=Mangrovicoccus algicola TaxID=2771008 RepID=A0A8J6Z715_9RHOB|nr:aminotransferase class I/II-fold pyridoxal phosphate-dependent enzyme [Mangrovicoccus algicola]MBE3639099.1 aminotransferase class I/II-fold pyridoxal phosphate-dependent enzyme [Mangrovicoccus algicola]
MQYPDRFSDLPAYAFPRLRALLDHHAPGGAPLSMSIGEPKHAFPDWVTRIIAENAVGFGSYPANDGTPALLSAIAAWIGRRYGVTVDGATQVMALNGSREGLYNIAMAIAPETKAGQRPVFLMPNPFYQAYAVAAISVGAEPVMVPATRATGHLPDYASLPPETLDRVSLCYICSPSNPQGAVADEAYWRDLLALAERHDFRIVADECYSEVYRGAPPPGILAAAAVAGADPERVLAIHSLSKRSNLPGLRSGAVTSGPENIRRIRQLRAYGGAPLPLPLQAAAAAVWEDEAHVVENRRLYGLKFDMADRIFADVPGYEPPRAGFFLWLPVPDSEAACLKLWQETGVRCLPGAYLGRDSGVGNPGAGYIRVALVAPMEQTEAGLTLIRHCLYDS